MANLAKSVNGKDNADEENIVEWINFNTNDTDFEHLADEQILDRALGMVFKESENE